MENIGPYAFNAVRYAIGVLILLPLIWHRKRKAPEAKAAAENNPSKHGGLLKRMLPFLVTGSVMFIGASLQQLGIVTTTAGNAAFVTSLYVVIIPLLASFFGRETVFKDYAAALISVFGLYIITVGFSSGFSIAPGDLLVLAGSLFWAIHILVIGKFASSVDPIKLSAGQFAVCGFLSFIAALLFEPAPFAGTFKALVPLLYGGLLSCGVAFTLQIVAQRRAPPAHASILLATEGLFGAIGGVLLLDEPATIRLFAGGALMLGAAILSQLPVGKAKGARAP